MTDHPHPVDVHVGATVRERRRAIGMSQGDLARALGITFQQVQKYERGANRVSASRLVECAAALGCSPCDLLPGAAASVRSHVDTITAKPGGEAILGMLAEAKPAQMRMFGAFLSATGGA